MPQARRNVRNPTRTCLQHLPSPRVYAVVHSPHWCKRRTVTLSERVLSAPTPPIQITTVYRKCAGFNVPPTVCSSRHRHFGDSPVSETKTTQYVALVTVALHMIDSTLPHIPANLQSRAQDALTAHLTHATDDTDTHRRYHARLSEELEYIRTAGLAPYISAVTALVDRARELGIVVGPGRGSAPSFLVLYLLGVTQIDPITSLSGPRETDGWSSTPTATPWKLRETGNT